LSSVTITHPFHPLAGQRLAVLFSSQRGGTRMLTCQAGSGRVTVAESWTDRGPTPARHRLAIEGLLALVGLVESLAADAGDSTTVRVERECADPVELTWRYGQDCPVRRDCHGVGEHDHLEAGGWP
jgi:hypothetical protein